MTLRGLISVWCLSVLLTAASSCVREEAGDGMARVVFSADVRTRSSVTPHESDVNTLDILVFRASSGALETSARVTGDHAGVSVLKGVGYIWYVIANAPEPVTAGNVSAFLGKRFALTDNSSSSLVMSGRGEGVLDGGEVTVSLSRLVSRVELGTVSPDYYQDAYADAKVTLSSVYLINAAGDVDVNGEGIGTTVWYNKGAYSPDSQVDEFLYSRRDESIAGGAVREENLYFYACPDASEGARLILEVDVEGNTEYYPVSIGPMAANTSYVIRDVRLLGPGASAPDGDVERASLSFTVTVNPWDDESEDVEL